MTVLGAQRSQKGSYDYAMLVCLIILLHFY